MLKIVSNVYWMSKIPRYFGKIWNSLVYRRMRSHSGNDNIVESSISRDFKTDGFKALAEKYDCHYFDSSTMELNQKKIVAFENKIEENWPGVKAMVLEVLKNPEYINLIRQYFGDRAYLWNIGLNFSPPSKYIVNSQKWHFDYGDTKQLHFIIYLTDVDLESGPFTFLPKNLSTKVKRNSLWMERLSDEELESTYGIDLENDVVKLTGEAGSAFIIDPGLLLHQGARCAKPRLALFLSVTSTSPMVRSFKGQLSSAYRKDLFLEYISVNKACLNNDFFGV